MAYSKFSLPEAARQFSLTLDEKTDLFPDVLPVQPSDFFRDLEQRFVPLGLAIGSEKARSEFIIAPLLVEVQGQASEPVSLFSGIDFNVDAERGLNGYCDFLLARSERQFYVEAPVFAIIEAKDEDIRSGLGQCAATMVATRLFNERDGGPSGAVYGAVTTGDVWRFLRWDGVTLSIDRVERFLRPVEHLLGVLLHIVQPGD